MVGFGEHQRALPKQLPSYAVRNILAHTGTDTNTFDPEGKEIRKSIELLRSWAKDS